MNYLDTEGPIINFTYTINGEIYVDKSLLIQKLNKLIRTDQRYVCITRPYQRHAEREDNDIRNNIREDLYEAYPDLNGKKYSRLDKMLNATGDSFIFILDEWDSIFFKKFMTVEDKQAYLDFLTGLLKGQPYVELAYMTGVLPIAKYSSGSALNRHCPPLGVFEEYNFTRCGPLA